MQETSNETDQGWGRYGVVCGNSFYCACGGCRGTCRVAAAVVAVAAVVVVVVVAAAAAAAVVPIVWIMLVYWVCVQQCIHIVQWENSLSDMSPKQKIKV